VVVGVVNPEEYGTRVLLVLDEGDVGDDL
jgi:hypothetical protein